MRKLQTHDVFMALKVVRAAGVREEVKRVALLTKLKEKNGEEIKLEDIGVDFILGCIEKLSGTESEYAIYDLLSGPLEMHPEEIMVMDPLELIEKITGLKEVIDMEAMKSFFKSVAALMEKLN